MSSWLVGVLGFYRRWWMTQKRCFYLKTEDFHRVFVSTAGPDGGIPVVCFHGGPGSGSSLSLFNFFDLSRHFVVLIDQRGAGRSLPAGRLKRNSTDWLLRDIEQIRQYLDIEQWHVFGGSWGATLAIAYAGSYPESVGQLILRGTFLASGREIRALFNASRFKAAQVWNRLRNIIGATSSDDMLHGLFRCLQQGGTPAWQAALAYSDLERAVLARANRAMGMRRATWSVQERHQQRLKYLIHTHYLLAACGLQGGRLTALARRATDHGIGGVAVHGKSDPLCPLSNLKWMRRNLPNIQQFVVEGGHLASEPEIYRTLCDAVSKLVPV